MKKNLFALLIVLVLASMVFTACAPTATPAPAPAEEKPTEAAAPAKAEEPAKAMKIAFFVSDLSNVFHQMQATEAKKYAKEKYGAEVFVFDGKSDSTVMVQNVDQVIAQGMDAATIQPWDADSNKPGVKAAMDKGIIMTSFFSPLADTGIPTARNDEKGISFAMGAEMATQWKAAHPDKPIVMVQLGWPNHVEVKSGRTDPFVAGVKSVDSTATDLGCLDASKGQDAAKQIIADLMTSHPEVNLIYSEASNLTVGTMAGLTNAGRGKFDNGKPLTEIVASVDFDEVEMKSVYDPNSSLKLSMGLPPVETARGRIDLIMDVASGKTKQNSDPAEEFFYKAYNISYWTMPGADAATWLNSQFGTKVEAPAGAAPAASAEKKDVKKIAFFVSDLSNVFHQMQATEAKRYAKEKYGVDVFVFDGKSDSTVMVQNVDQVIAQGMDAATIQPWDADSNKPGVEEALDKGIIMTSFFSPLADTGIPTARNDEKGISFAMGAEMATQWKAAHPDKPIVMVQLGWPNHVEVKSGRTDPFVAGVKSVDSTATDLGCLDASKGQDAAKQIIADLMTSHPEVNLIYSEASNLTVGTMAGLTNAGRGKFDNGKPLTEIVASVDFDEVEMKSVYDPNSSLKLSMGLPPIETARGRIDLIMDVASGKTKQNSDPAEEIFYKAYNISFWTMPGADAATWLNSQFGTKVEAPAAAAPAAAAPAASAAKKDVKKIAFFVSDLSNVFHQMQATEAKRYAKEKYGVDVFVFDGKSDSTVMVQNVDQVIAQGMDAATIQPWDADSNKPGVEEALDKGIIMTSFFSPLADTGIPTARNDEKGISFAMGAEMATQWKAAHPDKPIVMVQLGWPNHVEVKSGRTDPFVAGVKSVDSTATDLGCLDASKGQDAAKQIIADLMTSHPEVNLIYSEASNLTVGTMAGLTNAGRGKFDNGKPLTEIVASVDFDEVEMKLVYDPNSSLKLSMGLPPIETARGRIDLIMDVASGKTKQNSDPAEEVFYKAYNISYWTMPGSVAATWLNSQFGTKLEVKTGEITMPGNRFFGEGVTATSDGTFFAGSMEEGTIVKAAPGSDKAEPFIAAGANGLVSVLGLLADEANNVLWACSSDAGNSKLKGSAPVGVKAFDLKTGEAKGSYDFPGGGFCNDLTLDTKGNLYVTDSWAPRLLRLPVGGKALEEWVNDPQLGKEQWSLNGIDFDPSSGVIYTVNKNLGELFRVEIKSDGSAGAVTKIKTSQPLKGPDGLKVIDASTLWAAQGAGDGMDIITLTGDTAQVRSISAGLDGVATFAYYKGSAWVVENQGSHFWDPTNAGAEATKPFRIVEVPVN